MYLDNDERNEVVKISFYSPNEGYIAFSKGIGFTTDSGRTFIKKTITAGNVDFNGYQANFLWGFTINGIKAFDKNNIIVYGDYGEEPSILRSSNGGASYTLVYHAGFNNSTNTIKDVVFPENNNVGFAIDANYAYKTNDGGFTWQLALFNSATHIEAVDNNNVFFFNTDYNKQSLYRKTPTGWVNITLPSFPNGSKGLNYAYFLTASIGWICIYDNNYNPYIYKTTDGGVTWSLQNDIVATPFLAKKMKFVDENTGYALSWTQNTVYKTVNSGATWEPLPRDNDYEYLGYSHNDFQCLSSSQLWAGGGHGFLEMSTNGGGVPLPKAYFKIDTNGVAATGKVNLVNFSRQSYSYEWFVNGESVSKSFNASYSHDLYTNLDTVQLIVSNGINSDTQIVKQYFNAPPRPTVLAISDFSPASAYTDAMVTIKGIKFSNATNVLFGSVPAASFKILSDTVITAIVGNGESGSVSVTTANDTASLSGFAFSTRLKVKSFYPTSGSVGTNITIEGEKFSLTPTDNIVFFGGVQAQVKSSTSTQLIVTVPNGASYGCISVIKDSSVAYSNYYFLPTFSGGTPIDSNSFSSKVDFSADMSTFNIKTTDFDGDGKLDIVTGGEYYNRFSVYRNTSSTDSISFENAIFLEIQPGYYGREDFAIADFDGDGKPDIVAADGYHNNIYFFKNISSPGKIAFASKVNIIYDSNDSPTKFSVADFNGDGKLDIAVSHLNSNLLSIFENTSNSGNISFKALGLRLSCSTNFKVADIDGDDKTDIISSTYDNGGWVLFVYKNVSINNVISFAPAVQLPGTYPYALISVGDFNGDGQLDIAAKTSDKKISILKNVSRPSLISFEPPVNFDLPNNDVRALESEDLNGDGKPDLAVSYGLPPNPMVGILTNTGSLNKISFTPIIDFVKEPYHWCYAMAVSDINGDEKPDIVICNSDGSPNFRELISVLRNTSGHISVPVCISSAKANIASSLTGNSYQWQQNTGSGFVNIYDNDKFSGTNGMILQLSNVESQQNGYLYQCVVDNKISSVFSLKINEKVSPSVVINSLDTIFCIGRAIFTALPTNGGNNPGYQWQVNGLNVGNNNYQFVASDLKQGDKVSVILTSSETCVSQTTSASNIIAVDTISSAIVPAVTITANKESVCSGNDVLFTAYPLNEGNSPKYQWLVNGVATGFVGKTFVINNLKDSDKVSVILKSSAACIIADFVSSNTIIMSVMPKQTPSLSVNASATTICEGTDVIFTATPVNGGSAPSYQWQVNGLNVGTNINTFTSDTLQDNDRVKVVMNSNAECVSTFSAESNIIAMTVNSNKPPVLSVAASSTTICKGDGVEFTATAVNAGKAPVFQWKLNGGNVGTNSNVYTNANLQDEDLIKVSMTTGSDNCITGNVVVDANVITMNVKDTLTPSIEIRGITTLTNGSFANITSSVRNGGILSTMQWQDSTGAHLWKNITGENYSIITYHPLQTGDKIRAVLKTNSTCAVVPATISSNTLVFVITQTDSLTQGITLYPNPAISYLTIDGLKLNEEWLNLEIVNSAGERRIFIQDLIGKKQIVIPVQTLSAGFYLAILKKPNGESVYLRFMKL